MTFSCINDQTVDFRILNYQFPHINAGDWDSNWLLIYLKVQSDIGNWETIDPSLTTWDVKSLIEWFIALSNDIKPEENPLEFLEPNLQFLFLGTEGNSKRIKIKFDLESRPPSASDNTEYYVIGNWTNERLKMIAEQLTEELKKYPERK